MDSPTEQYEKSHLIERIRFRFTSLTGESIPVELFERMKLIRYNDMMELMIEIDCVSRTHPPVGG